MIIYKYLDPEGAEKTLKNRSILLSTPKKFNDPLDCYFYFDKEEKNNAYNLFLNYLFFTLFDNALVKKKKIRFDEFKGINIKKEIIETAKRINKTKRYKSIPLLNDFYEEGRKTFKLTDKYIESNFNKTIEDIFENIRNSTLVSSFSKSNSSFLMWSHYAKGHRGVCIEFEIDEDDINLVQVDYSNKMYSFELTKAMEIGLGHKLAKKKIEIDENKYRYMLNPLFLKSADWEYEQEVRYIFSLKNLDKEKATILSKGIIFLEVLKSKGLFLDVSLMKRL